MTYDVTFVEVQSGFGGFAALNTAMGFPTTPFDYAVFSFWTCFHNTAGRTPGGGPDYFFFFNLDAANPTSSLTLQDLHQDLPLYQANFTTPVGGVRSNTLISVDCARQVVQYYVNDLAVPVVSGGWQRTGRFQARTFANYWRVNCAFGVTFPAFADLWAAAPTSFFDLSLEANRRKFINNDLSPVDLGSDGSGPLGTRPQIYQTIRSGDAATAFLTNRGIGSSFVADHGVNLVFQAAGSCALPIAPILPGVDAVGAVGALTAISPPRLDMGDFVVTERITAKPELSLRWSDTRGASWSSWIRKAFTTTGEYDIDIAFYRLGLARDRVWEVSWATPSATALTGAFISFEIAGS